METTDNIMIVITEYNFTSRKKKKYIFFDKKRAECYLFAMWEELLIEKIEKDELNIDEMFEKRKNFSIGGVGYDWRVNVDFVDIN